MTLADAIAVLRALAVIPIAWAILVDLRAVALILFVAAAASDALDGWLARRGGSTSARGAFLDPLADKILVVGALAALTFAERVPSAIAALIIAREGIVAAMRSRAVARSIELRADLLAKAKTALEMAGIALVIVGGAGSAGGTALLVLALFIAIITLRRYVPQS